MATLTEKQLGLSETPAKAGLSPEQTHALAGLSCELVVAWDRAHSESELVENCQASIDALKKILRAAGYMD